MHERWGLLRPEDVSQWMNFDADNPRWHYSAAAPASMASRQAEGVAYLWNLLSKDRVALLADEVGMGKTLQALGVAALLWRMKPAAKVLVMAPNRDICAHWQRELTAFTSFHYREPDGRVKAGPEGSPVPSVESRFRLAELAELIAEQACLPPAPRVYLTTIHALSGLVDGADKEANKQKMAHLEATKIHGKIRRALGDGGLDLLIVDEAHYFRNPRSGSQRAAAAKAFFGQDGDRLAKRALLLTATPGHTRLEDVASILGHFIDIEPDHGGERAEDLMRSHALRRFRIMSGKTNSYTKHQYRREMAVPCDFAGHPEAELFFALYQRRLVHELDVLGEQRRVLYGFLEGFESAGAGFDPASGLPAEDEQAQGEHAKDFRAADDTELLGGMSRDYRAILGHAPDHPKYGEIVEACAPDGLFPWDTDRPLHEDKHLVFVRRIPSVRELTKRVNERYDRSLAREICDAWGLASDDPRVVRWERQAWSRAGFNELAKSAPAEPIEADDDEAPDDPVETMDKADAYLGSRVADLFVTKKKQHGMAAAAPTHCSRFSLAFRKASSMQAMFMEPASDYIEGAYSHFSEFPQGDKSRLDYTKAARHRRMSAHPFFDPGSAQSLPSRDATMRPYDAPVQTMWSLVFPLLGPAQQATIRKWAKERPDIAENFGEYVKAGFLFASPVVVELYGWHTRFQRANPANDQHANAQQRYQDFFAFARERIGGSLLLRYFSAALDSFEQLCDKIIDHKKGDWAKGWRSLMTLSSPAWFASGESSHRQHLILGFNSPFYPNTLVATSVFQEGVNLHLQCRKVHHYGIAWTPGDNEQRVGRIDRLFGKVNHLLLQGEPGTTTLDIGYLYLKGTFDEDQVGSFIERKHAVEEKMDRCVQGHFEKGVRMSRPGWKDFLREPVADSGPPDPYPARFPPIDAPGQAYPGR